MLNHMDSNFYQFIEERRDSILPLFPPTLDTISDFPIDPPIQFFLILWILLTRWIHLNPIANLMRTQ